MCEHKKLTVPEFVAFLRFAFLYIRIFHAFLLMHSVPLFLYSLINLYHSFSPWSYMFFPLNKWHHAWWLRIARLLGTTSIYELSYADLIMFDELSWIIYDFRTCSPKVLHIRLQRTNWQPLPYVCHSTQRSWKSRQQ